MKITQIKNELKTTEWEKFQHVIAVKIRTYLKNILQVKWMAS